MAFDAFISYSHKDKTAADAACAVLEAEGVRCWIAPRDIVAGTEWGRAIIEAIDSCRVMVLIFSSNTNVSAQIRREVERAIHRGVPVVPFRIEDVEPEGSLAYFMAGLHWLDALTAPIEAHLKRLARDLNALLGRPDQARLPSETAAPSAPNKDVEREPASIDAVVSVAKAASKTYADGPSEALTTDSEPLALEVARPTESRPDVEARIHTPATPGKNDDADHVVVNNGALSSRAARACGVLLVVLGVSSYLAYSTLQFAFSYGMRLAPLIWISGQPPNVFFGKVAHVVSAFFLLLQPCVVGYGIAMTSKRLRGFIGASRSIFIASRLCIVEGVFHGMMLSIMLVKFSDMIYWLAADLTTVNIVGSLASLVISVVVFVYIRRLRRDVP